MVVTNLEMERYRLDDGMRESMLVMAVGKVAQCLQAGGNLAGWGWCMQYGVVVSEYLHIIFSPAELTGPYSRIGSVMGKHAVYFQNGIHRKWLASPSAYRAHDRVVVVDHPLAVVARCAPSAQHLFCDQARCCLSLIHI